MVRNMDFRPQATGRGWRVSNRRGALSDLYKALVAWSVEHGLQRSQGERQEERPAEGTVPSRTEMTGVVCRKTQGVQEEV